MKIWYYLLIWLLFHCCMLRHVNALTTYQTDAKGWYANSMSSIDMLSFRGIAVWNNLNWFIYFSDSCGAQMPRLQSLGIIDASTFSLKQRLIKLLESMIMHPLITKLSFIRGRAWHLILQLSFLLLVVSTASLFFLHCGSSVL